MSSNSDCLCKGPKKCGRCRLIALSRARAEALNGKAAAPPPQTPLGPWPGGLARRS